MQDDSITIPGMVQKIAQSRPTDTALNFREDGDQQWRQISWAEYALAITRQAAGFQAVGLQAGNSVIVMLSTRPEWEFVEKAVLLNRAVVVGIETHVPAKTAQQIAEVVQPQLLICETLSLVENFDAGILDAVRTIFIREPFDTDSAQHLHADIRSLSTLEASEPTSFAPPELSPDDPAIVVFTSGTTGVPKGLEFSHRQVLLASAQILERFDWLGASHRTVCWLPLANLFQRMINLTAMSCGAAIYMVRDPRDLVSVLNDIKPTVLIGVPKLYQTIYQRFMERIAALPLGISRAMDLSKTGLHHRIVRGILFSRFRDIFGGQIECLISGSAPCPATLLEFYEASGMPLLEAYGVSENVVPVALNDLTNRRVGSVGKPLSANSVLVNESGAIEVKGTGVCTQYLNGTKITNADGSYDTGDLGHFDEDGFLFLSGRSSEVIKLDSGRKVNLSAVEQRLSCLPGVEQVVALGHGRAQLIALIYLYESEVANIDHLQHELRRLHTGISSLERVKGIGLLNHPFSIEQGELTRNLKYRRAQIAINMADLIEEVYAKVDSQAVSDDSICIVEQS